MSSRTNFGGVGMVVASEFVERCEGEYASAVQIYDEQLASVFAEADPEQQNTVPEPDGFENYLGELATLEPIYERMRQYGTRPVARFYVEGLSFEQNDRMLTGRSLQDGAISSGAACSSVGQYDTIRDASKLYNVTPNKVFPQAGIRQSPHWKYMIISDTDVPTTLRVGPDGDDGAGADEAIDLVKHINGFPEFVPDGLVKWMLIARASPTIDAYTHFQLRRILSGQKPADTIAPHTNVFRTILSQSVLYGDARRSLVGSWNDQKHAVTLSRVTPKSESKSPYKNKPPDTGMRYSFAATDIGGAIFVPYGTVGGVGA